MPDYVYFIIFAAAGLLIGIVAGILIRKKTAESKIGSAEEEARRILDDSLHNAEIKRKEILVEAKDESIRIKHEAEQETKERRREVAQQENRLAKREDDLTQKEKNLDKKIANLEQKEANLDETQKKAEALNAQIKESLDKQITELERISNFSREQAKAELLDRLSGELEHETALRISKFEEQYREQTSEKAKSLLSQAIQRCAADHVSEVAISVVALPNEEMKGRIIGREGRNIRTIENLTGVELIIDDTPEVITISGFDPIRREIARLSLEKLIADGRIHPTHIEEMVKKAENDVENAIRQAGEKAIYETGVHGIPAEELKLLGRLKFRTSYGQNILRHSVEVSLLAGVLAEELGVDSTMARRAGLLHDIGKALTAEAEGSHIQLGVEVARKFHEHKDVIHAIEAHHNDVEPTSILDYIIQAADAISAARPGARRDDVENYIKRLQKLEEIACGFDGVEKSYAIQAGREIRVMVKPDSVNDDRMKILAREIADKIENELEYPGQIKVNMIRESRYMELAK